MVRRDDPIGRHLPLILGGGSYCCLTFVWFSVPAYLGPLIDELELSSTRRASSRARSR